MLTELRRRIADWIVRIGFWLGHFTGTYWVTGATIDWIDEDGDRNIGVREVYYRGQIDSTLTLFSSDLFDGFPDGVEFEAEDDGEEEDYT